MNPGKVLLRAAVAAILLHIPPLQSGRAQAAPCLDVALVLSVDASASVSKHEFALQQKGIAEAFRDPEVLEAVSMAGRVAVSVIFWGSEGLAKPHSRWVLIDSPASAEQFAREVESMDRQVTGDTGLGAGLMAALLKFESLEECAFRKVVNVSGDGEETRVYRRMRQSLAPSQVKSLAESRNVEINALAITNDEIDLPEYYASNVITGPDAFVMQVERYEDFSHALRRKLIREIGPRVVSDQSGRKARGNHLN